MICRNSNDGFHKAGPVNRQGNAWCIRCGQPLIEVVQVPKLKLFTKVTAVLNIVMFILAMAFLAHWLTHFFK